MVGYQDDGKRRYKSFYGKTQKEAKDKAEAYKQKIAAGLYIDPNLTQHYLHVQEEVRQAAANKFSKNFKFTR